MKITVKSILAFSMLLFLSGALKADSFYSAFGLGVPHYFVSPQAGGMGGAGMAVQQYLSVNEMNPAALDLKGFTMISVSFQGEIIDNTVSEETVQTRQGGASGFRFVVPIKKNRIALILGLKPLVKSEMTVDFNKQYDDFTMLRTIGTSGGLTAASIGLKYSLFRWLHVGGVFNFNFGAYNETWKTEFNDDTYLNTTDDISSHLWGTGAELGLIYRPFRFLSFAGIVRTFADLHIETTITPGNGISLSPINQTALYPLAYGVGAAIDFDKLLLAGDLYTQRWESYLLDGEPSSLLTNYYRASVGLEVVMSKDFLAKYSKRISYRLGASVAQLPFLDTEGEAVLELLGTFGLGLPFNRNLGRVDLAVEIGKRFSADAYPYSERLIRVSASVTSAEKWFQRLY